MKYNLIIAIMMLSSSFYSHPIKMSNCSISISKKKDKMSIQFKLFTDDFKDCIEKNMKEKIDFNRLTLKQSDLIDQYINNSFQVIINNVSKKIFNPTIKINQTDNTIYLIYDDLNVNVKRNNHIMIKNNIIMDCNDSQTNYCSVQLKDIDKSFSFQFTKNNSKVTFKT